MNQRLDYPSRPSWARGAEQLLGSPAGIRLARHGRPLDANLKNPWGLSASGTSPFWISNNHTGTTTVYNSDGNPFPDAEPAGRHDSRVRPAGTGKSSPTGQTFNDTGSFELAPGKPALFLFCTEDGTIAGWNGSVSPSALNRRGQLRFRSRL